MLSGATFLTQPQNRLSGGRSPDICKKRKTMLAIFLCVKHGYIQIMVGRAGEPKARRVFTAGASNPAHLTTRRLRTLKFDSNRA